jgi:hypothetical protein
METLAAMSIPAMRAPTRASASAAARPTPGAAPVTTATFPASSPVGAFRVAIFTIFSAGYPQSGDVAE